MNVPSTLLKKTEELVAQQGILCKPLPKQGRKLSQETSDKVISFYYDPNNSRKMPGMRDYISVPANEKREHRQKRLVLGNLKELHSSF